jgi:hypothetical protein
MAFIAQSVEKVGMLRDDRIRCVENLKLKSREDRKRMLIQVKIEVWRKFSDITECDCVEPRRPYGRSLVAIRRCVSRSDPETTLLRCDLSQG